MRGSVILLLVAVFGIVIAVSSFVFIAGNSVQITKAADEEAAAQEVISEESVPAAVVQEEIISAEIASPLVCVVPFDNLNINTNTVLCPGSFTINDVDGLGVIKIVSNNIKLTCNNTLITGLGTGRGISVVNFNNATITGCTIINYQMGLLLLLSSNNTIINNTVRLNDYGIYTDRSHRNNVTNNTAVNNDIHGMLAVNTTFSRFLLNNFSFNEQKGFRLSVSDNNTFINNSFENNIHDGLFVGFGSENNTIKNNKFISNDNGINLSSSDKNIILSNNLSKNNKSINMFNSDFSNISSNFMLNNRLGIFVTNNSDGNQIDNNRGISNTIADVHLTINSNSNFGCNNATDIIDDNSNSIWTRLYDNINLRMNTTLCPGTYRLNDTDGEGVITMLDGIKLDCNGATIQGNNSRTAIFLSLDDNILIKNCNIKNFETGIKIQTSSDNNRILDNDFSNLKYAVAVLSSSDFNRIKNNNINSTQYGVFINFSSNNTVEDNTVTTFLGNGQGITLVNKANGNRIIDNFVTNSSYGILVDLNSNFNTMNYNNATKNNYGIRIDTSKNNEINFNFAQLNNIYGVNLFNSSNNEIILNSMCYNTVRDIALTLSPLKNTGDFNICERTLNWNDAGETGCTAKCPLCINQIWDLNETGVDCGGFCGQSCPSCIPAVSNGNTASKIDVVFVPDEDYRNVTTGTINLAKFRNDIRNLIKQGYYGSVPINASRCKFNFWYITNPGNYSPVCAQFNISTAATACSFRDSTAIVHLTSERDCSGSSAFSTEPTSYTTVRHESGHNIFGLKDEYCCDGGYSQPSCSNVYSSLSNCVIYAIANGLNSSKCFNFCPTIKCWPGTTQAILNCTASGWTQQQCNCTAFAQANGLSTSLCTSISPSSCPVFWQSTFKSRNVAPSALTKQSPNWCNYRGTGVQPCCDETPGNGWWKVDPDNKNPNNIGNCLMASGNDYNVSDLPCIANKFGTLPACTNPPSLPLNELASTYVIQQNETNNSKVVIVNLHIKQGVIRKIDGEVVYGEEPNRFVEPEDFAFIILYTTNNLSIGKFSIEDPRVFSFIPHFDEKIEDFRDPSEPGKLFLDNVNFPINLRFHPNLSRFDIVNKTDGSIIASINVTQEIQEFCSNNPNDPDCKPSFICGDVNGDGKINLSDIIYLVNYIFKGGPAPVPLAAGDVNKDGKVNLSDIIYLVNYIFKGGPKPCA